jgi:hypothetical protein
MGGRLSKSVVINAGRCAKCTRVLAALLVVALVAAGCGSSQAGESASADWVTFEGQSVSLDLPKSFKGGDPRDPDVIAALEKIAARNPNPTFAKNWASYLEDLPMSAAGVLTELAAWGEPNAYGHMAMVTVKRTELEGWAEWTSLQEFAQMGVVLNHPPDYSYTVESMTENRAFVVVRDAYEKAPEDVLFYYQVILTDGKYLYTIFYNFDAESNTALDAVFRASAGSIVVGIQ